MAPLVAVPLTIPRRERYDSRLGLLDEIRKAVRTAKTRHPLLASSRLHDVALRRQRESLHVTLYFRPTATDR